MRFRFFLFPALLFLNACSFQSAPDKLRQELQTISSWAATARMVGEALMNGHVPPAYAARTFEAARQELQAEDQTLAKSSDIPAAQRADVKAWLARLQQIIGQLKTSAERKDNSSLSNLIEQLKLEEGALNSSLRDDSGRL